MLTLRAWREQTLLKLLRIAFVVMLLPVALDIVGSWERGRLDWIIFQVVGLGFFGGLAFWGPLGYKLRAYGLLGLCIVYALLTTLNLGLVGAGRLHVLFAVTLAVLLLERREALGVWALVSVLGVGVLGAMGLGLIPIPDSVPQRAIDRNTFLVNTLILVAFSIASGSAVLSLITRLTQSLLMATDAIAERDALTMSLETMVEARTEELRRSQALLQGFLDNSPAAVYVKDLEGRYLLTNEYMHRTYGLSAAQMNGRRDVELFGEAAEPWRAHEQAVLASGETIASEAVADGGEGARTYYEIKFPLRSAGGAITAIGGIAADISERKQAEEKLARQLRLQAAVARCARTLLRATVAPHQREAFLSAVFEEFRVSAGLAHMGLYCFSQAADELHYKSLFQLPDPTTATASTPISSLSSAVSEPLLRGEPVAAPAEQAFQPGAVNHAFWQRRNIGGLAAALITVDGRAWGFAGFGTPRGLSLPDQQELAMLGALAEMVGAFLSRLEVNRALERQRAYAQALARCSAALLAEMERSETRAEAYLDALGHLLEAVRCIRAYVYEMLPAGADGFVARLRAEACAPEVSSDPRTARLPEALFPEATLTELRAGRAVGGPIATLMADSPAYHDLLRDAGVGSVLMMPIHLDGCMWGFLGLSDTAAERAWLPDDLQMLRTAAEMLAAFVRGRMILRALREREHFIQRITEASPDLIYVFDLAERRNVFANRELSSLLGYTLEEAQELGPRLLETLLRPEDLARFPAFQAQAWAALDNEVVEFEYQARRTDGALRWLVSREVVFTRDRDGRPAQMLGLTRDVTETKEASIAVEQNAALLRTISDAIPDGYLYQVVQRPDGSYVGYTYLSRGIEQLLGISIEAALADPSLVREAVLPEDRPQFDAADNESVRILGTFDVEVRLRRADGGIGWFQMRSVPRLMPDGQILWNGVCLDISQRKAIELALTKTNQAMRHRVDELAALNQIAQALMSWTDLPAALRTVGAMLLPLFAAGRVAVWLREDERDALFQVAVIGHEGASLGGTTVRLRDVPLARAVLNARRGSVLDGGRSDQVIIPPLAGGLDAMDSSALVQPLLVRGSSIGLLVLRAAPGRPTFTPADVELAQTIAGLLSNAIENGRLFQRTMVEAAQEERRRLARELHDSISQSLYSLVLLSRAWGRMAPGAAPADLADWFGQVEGVALQSLKEMRLLIYQLRSQELDDQGLAETLRHRLAAVEGRSGVTVRLDADSYSQPVSPLVEPQLYAVIQEALNNALRHAGATAITIVLRSDEEGVLVEVRDNGRGFDAEQPSAGLGLTTMRERAEAIGGKLSLTSAPGQGVAVRLLLPPEQPGRQDGLAKAGARRRKR